MINRDGYVSVLDDDGHLRSDLIVDDDEMKTTLTKKMNSDNDADIIVSLALFYYQMHCSEKQKFQHKIKNWISSSSELFTE